MNIVATFGVWDILHVGHVAYLERAKALGDRLVVGCPSDAAVASDKARLPVINHTDRMRMLESLRCVDVVIPYHELNFLPVLNAVKPDILVVGETWGSDRRHIDAELWAADNECRIVELPYSKGESSTEIRERILQRYIGG